MRLDDTSTVCDGVQLNPFQCGPAHWLITHPDQKGMLCCYGTGYGKSLTAIATIAALLRAGVVNHCVVVTPLSLKDNMAKEFGTCGSGPAVQAARDNTVILHYAQAVRDGQGVAAVKRAKKCLLVIDEAHNLKTETASAKTQLNETIHEMLRVACGKGNGGRVLLLTATPMPNTPADVIPLLRLIDPSIPALPKDPKDRDRLVTAAYLAQHAQHLVAFPGMDLSPHFPREVHKRVEVPLADRAQLAKLADLDQPSKQKRAGDGLSKAYLTLPRKACLFLNNGRPTAKMLALAANLKQTKARPALVFTEYTGEEEHKDKTYIIKQIVRTVQDAAPHLRAAYLTGDTRAEDRQGLVNAMNAGQLDVLVMSSAGAEGLDFKGVREVHLLTPDWSPGEVDQKVGRAVRFRSHAALPPAEQEVTVFRYVAVPVGERVDEYLAWQGAFPHPPILREEPSGIEGITELKRGTTRKDHIVPARYVEMYLLRQEAGKRAAIVEALTALKAVGVEQRCFRVGPAPKKAVAVAPSGRRLGPCSAMLPAVDVGARFRALNGREYLAVEDGRGGRRWVRLNAAGEVAKGRTPGRKDRIPPMCSAAFATNPVVKENHQYRLLDGNTYLAVRKRSRSGESRLQFQKV